MNADKENIIQSDKTKGSVGWGPVHLEKHLCFRGRREQKQDKERKEKGIVPGLQVCVGKAGKPCALKAFIAGWPPLAVPSTLPPGVLCSRAHRQCALSFSLSPPSAIANSPELLPRWRRVSTLCRKQEGEKPKPNV